MARTFHIAVFQKKGDDVVDNIEQHNVGAFNIGGSLIISDKYLDGKKPSNVILVENDYNSIVHKIDSAEVNEHYKVLGED